MTNLYEGGTMIITFTNPANGYSENYNTSTAPLWCLLFGFLYWLVRGNIFHAIIALVLAFCTFGASWLIYPFFANQINIKSYGKKGWIQNGATPPIYTPAAAPSSQPQNSSNVTSTPLRPWSKEWIEDKSRKNWAWYHRNFKKALIIGAILGMIVGQLLSEKREKQGHNSSALYDIMYGKSK